METHELDIEISPDGRMKVHVQGAKGPACMEYVKLLQGIMGSAEEVSHTAEYYEPPTGVQIHLDQQAKR